MQKLSLKISALALLLSTECFAQVQSKKTKPQEDRARLRATGSKSEERKQIAQRLKILDKLSLLADDKHETLWKKNIILAIKNDGDARCEIDAIGIASTAIVRERRPTMCVELMKLANEEVVGRNLDYPALAELLLSLKNRVDIVWEKTQSKDFPEVIFRAELVNHFSTIRKANETWLLVDVHHVDKLPSDLMVSDLINRTGQLNSEDPRSHIVYDPPHPRAEESLHFYTNLPPLEPERRKATVTVVDDGLTNRQREAEFGFNFTDSTDFNTHQIESVGWTGIDRDERTDWCLGQASMLILDRLPCGSRVSDDELHLRLGSVTKVLNSRFPEYWLEIVVREYKCGKRVYSSIVFDLIRK